MRTLRQYMYLALAIAVAGVLGAGGVRAAYDQGDEDAQYQNQQGQYQEQDQDEYETRNIQLERQIARQLRDEGLGEQGEIMILATGNRVILLGNVPDQSSKNQAAQSTRQVPGVTNVDNRLHVVKQPKQLSDMQLERDVDNKLPDHLAQNVQVQAQNGTVTLRGSVSNWKEAADAIDAAFASGAQQVDSQLTVGAAGYGRYGAAGPAGGYAPEARGQAMTGRERASSSDLNLAQQVAQQLRQGLPSEQNIQVVRPMSIYVTVKNGTATLHGYVRDANQKQEAEQIASSVPGIRNVTNDLAILSGAGTMGRMGGQQGSGGMTGQYGQGGAGMGNQGMAGGQMSMSDRRTAQQIQQHLQDQFPDANIRVTARQGTVTLQGTVSDLNEKQEAEQTAQSFPGVQNVQNNLTISGPAGQQGMTGQMEAQGAMSASDLALARQVAQKLQQQLSGIRNVQVERPGTIYVMAAQGTVMLYGFAADTSIRQQATTIASTIPGVRNVENTLAISAGAGAAPSYGYMPGQPSQPQEGTGGMSSQDTTGRYSEIAYEDQMSRSGQATQAKAFGTSAADLAKAQRIQQSLQSQLPDADITVTVSGNNATLWGTAPDAQEKQQARQIAQSISGISNVTNNLTIGGQETAGEMGEMGEQPPSLRFIAEADNQTATKPTDAALAQRVAQMLQEQLHAVSNTQIQIMRPNTIYVAVSKGTVTLDGIIPDKNVKDEAGRLAKAVPGVKNVRNSLTVGATGTYGQAGEQWYGPQTSRTPQTAPQPGDY